MVREFQCSPKDIERFVTNMSAFLTREDETGYLKPEQLYEKRYEIAVHYARGLAARHSLELDEISLSYQLKVEQTTNLRDMLIAMHYAAHQVMAQILIAHQAGLLELTDNQLSFYRGATRDCIVK